MRATALILITICLLTSCAKENAKFCYTCTQKYSYRVQNNVPAHDEIETRQECDKDYEDIAKLESETQGEETAYYTSYPLECERQQ